MWPGTGAVRRTDAVYGNSYVRCIFFKDSRLGKLKDFSINYFANITLFKI